MTLLLKILIMALVAGYDYHFTAEAGVTTSGNSVTGWTDQVSGTKQLTVPSGQSSPLVGQGQYNGVDFLAFDGANGGSVLQMSDTIDRAPSSSGRCTMGYYLIRSPIDSNFNYWVDGGNGINDEAGHFGNGEITVRAGSTSVSYSVVDEQNTWIVITLTWGHDAGSILNKVYINGTEKASGGPKDSDGTGLTIGSRQDFFGEGQFDIMAAVEYLDIAAEHTQSEIDQNVTELQNIGSAGQTITIDKGTFSLTGYDLFANQQVVLDKGGFTLSGYDLALNQSVIIDRGQFTLSGYQLATNKNVPLDKGGFTLTGYDLALNQTMILDRGQFTVSGYPLALNANVVLDKGTFTLTGYDLDFVSGGASITLDKGTFSVSGYDLAFNRTVPLDKGTFSLDGKTLSFNVSIPVDKGSFSLTGYDLNYKSVVPLDKGTFLVTGYDLAFSTTDNLVILTLQSTITTDIELDSTISDVEGDSTIGDVELDSLL